MGFRFVEESEEYSPADDKVFMVTYLGL